MQRRSPSSTSRGSKRQTRLSSHGGSKRAQHFTQGRELSSISSLTSTVGQHHGSGAATPAAQGFSRAIRSGSRGSAPRSTSPATIQKRSLACGTGTVTSHAHLQGEEGRFLRAVSTLTSHRAGVASRSLSKQESMERSTASAFQQYPTQQQPPQPHVQTTSRKISPHSKILSGSRNTASQQPATMVPSLSHTGSPFQQVFRPTRPVRSAAPNLMESLSSSGSLSDNPLFTAGLGMTAIGLSLSILRKAALQGLVLLERHMTTSLEIPSKDRSYYWVLNWCTAQTKGTSKHIGVETRVVHHGNGVHTTSFDFVPSPGRHFIWYNRHLIQIVREREKSMMDITSGSPFETVKLTVFSRNREIFSDILKEAEASAMRKQEGRITIYMPMMTDWRQFGRPRPKRRLDSVILDEGIAESLENDIREFQRGNQWYADKGIPHRRGYLLYGPPGSGKTSFIQALAGELGYSICVLSLNDRGLTDDRLLHLMTELPPRSIILLEDIDAVFNQRESSFSVTFSGLLNALDGVTSIDERLVFMTTNHVEKLDPALVRPGRVDVRVYIGDSTPYQQRRMFQSFYPEITDANDTTSSTTTAGKSSSMLASSSFLAKATQAAKGSSASSGAETTSAGDAPSEKQETFVRGLLNRVVETTGLDNMKKSDPGMVVENGVVQRLSMDAVARRVDLSSFGTAPTKVARGGKEGVSLVGGDGDDDDDWTNPDKILQSAQAQSDTVVKGTKHSSDNNPQGENDTEADVSSSPGVSPLVAALDHNVSVTERMPQLLAQRDEIEDQLKQLQSQTPTQTQLESAKLLQAAVNAKRVRGGLRALPLEDFLNDPLVLAKREDAPVGIDAEKKTSDHAAVEKSESSPATAVGTTAENKTSAEDTTASGAKKAPIDYLKISRERMEQEQRKKSEYEKLCDEFVEALSGAPISMAELQSLMLQYKDQPRLCIQGAVELKETKLKQLAEKEAQQQEVSEASNTPAAGSRQATARQQGQRYPTHNQPFQSHQFISQQMSQAVQSANANASLSSHQVNSVSAAGNASSKTMGKM